MCFPAISFYNPRIYEGFILSTSLQNLFFFLNNNNDNSYPMGVRGFPGGSDSKESACNAENLSLTLGSGRSPGEGNGNPL